VAFNNNVLQHVLSASSKALFSSEKISDFGTVVFLCIYGKYCPIIRLKKLVS